MTITLPWWSLPLALTLLAWGLALYLPIKSRGGLGVDIVGLLCAGWRIFLATAFTGILWIVSLTLRLWFV